MDPSKFLRVYETTIEAIGGDDTTKAKSVTLALTGVALTWFFTIPPPLHLRMGAVMGPRPQQLLGKLHGAQERGTLIRSEASPW